MQPKTDDDKYGAIWLSHSSISDFLKCPRLYYYANMYKNPRSGKKISIIKPALALGQVVHGALDELASLPVDQRFGEPLEKRITRMWETIAGKKGGFQSDDQENDYKNRALQMVQTVQQHPGPLASKALRLKQDLPNYWFSEEDNMILCGKIDWIEYLEATDSIHVLDFKTGRTREKEGSLQLPIYLLLLLHTQSRKIEKMSYWYMQLSDTPEEVALPDEDTAKQQIMQIAKRIKLARQLNHFNCEVDEKNGCRHCAPYEAVIKGKGEFVGVGEYNREMYILTESSVAL